MIESLTAFLAVGLFYKFGIGTPYFFWFCFGSTLITVTFIDIDHQIIPDRISLSGIILFASSCILIPDMTIKDTALGIITGGGLPYLLALGYYTIRKQQGLGGGDIKLLAMIGAATGVPGVLFSLFFGSLSGMIYGLGTTFETRQKGLVKIPFGPFLSLGALVYVFTGKELVRWYMALLIS